MLDEQQVPIVDKWLRSVLWENELPNDGAEHKVPFEVHRLKGRLAIQHGQTKIIQGVRELFEIFDSPDPSHEEGANETGKIVLIGRHVADYDFEASLAAAVRESTSVDA